MWSNFATTVRRAKQRGIATPNDAVPSYRDTAFSSGFMDARYSITVTSTCMRETPHIFVHVIENTARNFLDSSLIVKPGNWQSKTLR